MNNILKWIFVLLKTDQLHRGCRFPRSRRRQSLLAILSHCLPYLRSSRSHFHCCVLTNLEKWMRTFLFSSFKLTKTCVTYAKPSLKIQDWCLCAFVFCFTLFGVVWATTGSAPIGGDGLITAGFILLIVATTDLATALHRLKRTLGVMQREM